MRISDWSSDVCSSDLAVPRAENGFTRFFDQAVPFTAFLALSLPTKGHRSTLLADIFLLHLRHSPCFIRTYAEHSRESGNRANILSSVCYSPLLQRAPVDRKIVQSGNSVSVRVDL